MMKDIIFFYVKYYYDKYLSENNLSILNETQINDFINTHYTNKGKEIKDYVRNSLKKNLGDKYNSLTVENILLELFNDIDMAKERLKIEIIDYQNNHM
jgi:hypothetical protein